MPENDRVSDRNGRTLDRGPSGMQSAAFRILTESERRVLETLGDVLLPGARDAGIARYVDDQLSGATSLLFLKYMDYAGSPASFYKDGLSALDRESVGRFGRPFAACSAEQQEGLVRDIAGGTPAGWSGPPAPLLYFVVRNDALDVYYGTPEGFDRLGIAYAPLAIPPAEW